MSHSVRIHNTIKIGSTKKRASVEKKSIDEIMNELVNETRCVIHLIDTSAYNSAKDDRDDSEKIDINEINQIITDQHMELWRMMKRGDLVEDMSLSGYMSRGRFIVDKDDTKDDKINNMDIIRRGLVVKDLDRDIGPKGSCQIPNDKRDGTILKTMYTITEFSPGHFDDNNLVVNDYLFPGELPKSIWKESQNVVWLDTEKLNLDKITNDDIFHIINRVKNFDIHYLYLIIEYNKVAYLLYGTYSDRYSKHDIKKITKNIINRLRTTKAFISEKIDENAYKIASTKKIEKKYILNIL